MKIKLIYILSAFLLCGCSPTLNRTYKVKLCEVVAGEGGLPLYYKVLVYEARSDPRKFGADEQEFYSDTPLTVGAPYVLRLEEVK